MRTSYDTMEEFLVDLRVMLTSQKVADRQPGLDDIVLFSELRKWYDEIEIATGFLIHYVDDVKMRLTCKRNIVDRIESELEVTCYNKMRDTNVANRPKTMADARRQVLAGNQELRERLITTNQEIAILDVTLSSLVQYQEALRDRRWDLKHVTEMWIVERKKDPA